MADPGRAQAPWPELSGYRIRRIDAPARGMLSLSLERRDDLCHLVAVLDGASRGIGLCETRPKGDAAGAFVQALRKHLGHSRLSDVCLLAPGCLGLRFETREGLRVLHLEFDRARGNAVLTAGRGQVLAKLHATTDPYAVPEGTPPLAWPAGIDGLRAAGAPLVSTHRAAELQRQRTGLSRAITRRRRQLTRRMSAIEGDAARAEEAPALRARAGALLSQLHCIPEGVTEVRLRVPDGDTVTEITEPLPAGVGARQRAEQLYRQARRVETGAHHAQQRAALTRQTLDELQALEATLASCGPAEVDALRERARRSGVSLGASASSSIGASVRRRPAERLPYREYEVAGGIVALVGRGASDNDKLTLKTARPHDLFVHARDVPGAHVIVRLARGQVCPPDALADAATLAAHFSDARGQSPVDVVHVGRRHVRKARGSAVGAVQLQREKVLRLRPDDERLARLLATVRA